jgi:hypothetical protein
MIFEDDHDGWRSFGQVKDALLKEEIHPNDRDPFQRYDRIYGPSIYTVLGTESRELLNKMNKSMEHVNIS